MNEDLLTVVAIVALIILVPVWIGLSIMLWRDYQMRRAHKRTNRLIDAIRNDRTPALKYQPQYTPRHWNGKTK